MNLEQNEQEKLAMNNSNSGELDIELEEDDSEDDSEDGEDEIEDSAEQPKNDPFDTDYWVMQPAPKLEFKKEHKIPEIIGLTTNSEDGEVVLVAGFKGASIQDYVKVFPSFLEAWQEALRLNAEGIDCKSEREQCWEMLLGIKAEKALKYAITSDKCECEHCETLKQVYDGFCNAEDVDTVDFSELGFSFRS